MINFFKKITKIILIVVIILFVVISALLFYMDNFPSVFKGYNNKIATGGEIESKYLQTGQYETSHVTIKTEEPMKNYTIYYPNELQSNDKKYPVVFIVNGTGCKATKFKALYERLASWGFIVVGNQDRNTGTGESTSKTLDYILAERENIDSIFYNKIDIDNIGICGYSQGGAAVINAITMYDNSKYFKTAVTLSPANEEVAKNTGYPYDITKVNIPTMMLAGTSGVFETEYVIPIEQMKSMYEEMNTSKLMLRKIGADHDSMSYAADGYVTAWFMWQLQGDEYAATAFCGKESEIYENDLYQDIQSNL